MNPNNQKPRKNDGLFIGLLIAMIIFMAILSVLSTIPEEFNGASPSVATLASLACLPQVIVMSTIFMSAIGLIALVLKKTIFKNIHIPARLVRPLLILISLILFATLIYWATRY